VLAFVPPHLGHRKPSGHRIRTRYCRHASSVANRVSNSAMVRGSSSTETNTTLHWGRLSQKDSLLSLKGDRPFQRTLDPWGRSNSGDTKAEWRLVQPTPQRAAANGGHQTRTIDLLRQIGSTLTRQRQMVSSGQFTSPSFDLHNQVRGKKSGDDPDEGVLLDPETFQKESFAPLRDDITTGIQARGYFAVFQSLGSHQNYLGALDLKIRQRISGGAPAQFGAFRGRLHWGHGQSPSFGNDIRAVTELAGTQVVTAGGVRRDFHSSRMAAVPVVPMRVQPAA
jgi:hypothetical protein